MDTLGAGGDGGRGGSEFRTDGAEMNILFLCGVEKVSYQRRLATMLESWRRVKAVPTVPGVTFSCLDEDWSPLSLVVKRQYQVREHHFETRLGIPHNLLVGWQSGETFSIMPADRGGLCLVLPPW